MKFTDGYWMLQEGVEPQYPAQLYDTKQVGDVLTLYAPCRCVKGRGDMMDRAMLSVELSSPMENVIRVRISHFMGEKTKTPSFHLTVADETPVQITDDGETVAFLSGQLSARASRRNKWKLEFLVGSQVLTSSTDKGMAFLKTREGFFVREELSLGVGETVYGFGERFTAFVKNGQSIDVWNRDGGTSSEQAYKNIPFYLTNYGYGVFVNQPERVSFEVASEKLSRVQFSVPGQSLEYFVIYGPDPKAILKRYTALTGRPVIPPAWSFGLWLSTSFTTAYTEETVKDIVLKMSAHNLPVHVFHFDSFWMREFSWCDFAWDLRNFPDPVEMLAWLKSKGIHTCVWINPYISQRSTLFEEGKQNGFFLMKPNGDIWQTDLWQPGMAIIDFTNPSACSWYADKLRSLLDMGVDSFKTDFGERIPTDVVYFDGSDPERMHNYYTYLYNRTVFNVLREKRENSAVVFARSATVGSQCFPVHWGGDCESNFESMAESLRGGLSLGLSGFGFWSHDIGGFEGSPDPKVYKRWIAFGLLSSHSRLHGSSSYRVPWLFDEESVEVLRRFTMLKCSLMPYIYQQAVEASTSGVPIMRAMILEFAGDPACTYLDRQYMLGDSLLVAPVFSNSGVVEYYVPAGRWTNYLTGEQVDAGSSGAWRRETWDFLGLPLLVRPASVIPVGNIQDRPDYDYADGVTLEAFELEDEAPVTTVITSPDRMEKTSFKTVKSGLSVMVLRMETGEHPKHRSWRFLLCGYMRGGKAEGCDVETNSRGLLVKVPANLDTLTISLNA